MAILNLKVKTEIFPSFYKKQTCCVNQGMRTTLLKKLENFLHTKVINASNCMDCRNFSQDLSKILRLRYLRACYTLHKKIPFSQSPAALVTFTEEIFNGKLHILCSIRSLLISVFSNKTRIKKASLS